ncbi:hypothetical protein ACIBED_07025 [Rhodococcus coprophilus]|uniref:Uncharacterized protein n=1 Tax=Rhodococcus coprophilus TaxID=38310 RepID=A0A2X4XMA7_9NOCA|nr:hypothetical protein [Rhodococcus coprophilus]MBM7459970.1 hypothetical protein [Rhodococcus coprophilus]SQI37794.1 Uncharacterised protein [Rhodococcus coprophilus]
MTPAPDPGRILDAGVGGLTFFAEYLPCAHRWGAATSTTVESLRERYDEQRDLDLATLVADASDLTRLATVLAGPILEQDGQVRFLPRAWEGDAADTARSRLDTVVARGRALQSGVQELSHALTVAAANVGAAVTEKARIVGLFEGKLVDGRTSDEVAMILAGAAGEPGGPTPGQISRWFHSAGGDDPVSTAEPCARWLSERFAPALGTAVDTFLRACDDTDWVVMNEFDSLARLFDLIERSGEAGVPSGYGRLPTSGAPLGSGRNGSSSGPGTDAVQAGADLLGAAAGLAGAVLDLATSGVKAATALLDAAVETLPEPTTPDAVLPEAGPEAPPVTREEGGVTPTGPEDRHPVNAPASGTPSAPPPVDIPAGPPPEAGPDAGISDPGDAAATRAEPTGEENDAPGTKENGVTPATVPPGSIRREKTNSRETPVAAGSDQAGEPAEPAEGRAATDGGAVLAEAGPL